MVSVYIDAVPTIDIAFLTYIRNHEGNNVLLAIEAEKIKTVFLTFGDEVGIRVLAQRNKKTKRMVHTRLFTFVSKVCIAFGFFHG